MYKNIYTYYIWVSLDFIELLPNQFMGELMTGTRPDDAQSIANICQPYLWQKWKISRGCIWENKGGASAYM